MYSVIGPKFFSACFLLVAILTSIGCVSEKERRMIRGSITSSLCRNYMNVPSGHRLEQAYIEEIRRRRANCNEYGNVSLAKAVANQRERQRTAAVAAALRGLGEVASGQPAPTLNADYDWDWDYFRDQYGNLTYRCRGIQTGQFADNARCAYDLRDDDRWPGY